MVPLALLALLIGGWGMPSRGAPAVSVGVVLTILVLPGLLASAAALARRPSELPFLRHLAEIAVATGRELAREGLALATLPYDAFVDAVAIARTASRVLVTRRKMLEWRTAADAQRAARTELAGAYRVMWIAPTVAAIAAGWLGLRNPIALPIALPVLLLWVAGPGIAWWLSRPTTLPAPRLSASELRFLRGIARRTWRFFETWVGPEDHDLPPDNVQEDPPRGAAHRTSPTNIGLALTANLAAYDFGYLTAGGLLDRVGRTLDTVDRLPRFRGHLLNWYDTTTLEPLRPAYVSSVDSGNLVGHLLVLASGLDELARQPIWRTEAFTALADPLVLAGDPTALGPPPPTLAEAHARLLALAAHHAPHEPEEWGARFEDQRRALTDELGSLAPWLGLPVPDAALATALDRVPTLAEAARLAVELNPRIDAILAESGLAGSGLAGSSVDAGVGEALRRLRDAIGLGAGRAAARIAAARALAARCRSYADPEWDFLYDRHRHLLSIGYNVSDHRLDAGHYDLLASESRLGSFVAIARRALPQEHWFSLGRLLTTTAGRPALLSWSGSMFEYLMPQLVMPTHDGTILDETNRGVVERQIRYGAERGVPWGVSESGYAKTDAQLNYQYRAFGVPGLGFKRGLGDDIVIAPYATALALMVDPESACANLQRLDQAGQRGLYGFYEAVDYTPSRLPRGRDHVTVASYMAHHQGMTFLSLAYLLLGRPMQRRFLADRSLRACELLLHERVPRTPPLYPHPAEVDAAAERAVDAGANVRVIGSPDTPAPAVQLLSNGAYHVVVTQAGGGYSRWRGLAVTRWHEDPTRDGWGSFAYLRDLGTGAVWSSTHHPTLVRAGSYEAIFALGRAEFRRTDGWITTHVEIAVSPEDDVELRRISLTNTGRTARTIELTSYAEVVLAPPGADAAHPAFSNLFVQTELLPDQHAILCTRRPRSGGETPPWLVHLATVHGTQVGTMSYETSRRAFIGRGRSTVDPVALTQPRLTDEAGSVLDPVIAIRTTIRLEPDETARIHLFTGVTETRAAATALIAKCSDRHAPGRLFELGWTHDQALARRLDLTEADTQLFERLAGRILYADPSMRAPAAAIARNRRGQAGLWAYSISGDLPIVLVRIARRDDLPVVRQLVQAHAYWRLKGLATDLVVWNEDPSGYRQDLQDELMGAITALGESGVLERPGGIFVRRIEQLAEDDKLLMRTVARVIVGEVEGDLVAQVDRRPPARTPMPPFAGTARRATAARGDAAPTARPDLVGFNGHGGFTRDGREYVVVTTAGARTPAPWVNVLANPWFGTVVSESGSAYTWCENARSYRLTPWHDDPVSDPSGESFWLRDEHDGRFWSPTPLPSPGPRVYTTRHGFGYSVFEYTDDGIASTLQMFVAIDAPVKLMLFTIRNTSDRPRRLTLTGCFELVLGEGRPANLPHVVTEIDPLTAALIGRNAYATEFAERVAFLDCSDDHRSVTGDRAEILGRNGTAADPRCMGRARLSDRVGAGLDPCLGMRVDVELAPGQSRQVAFAFGSGMDLEDARTLARRFRSVDAARVALAQVWSHWNQVLGAVHVRTPEPSLDVLANGWLLYQVIASRLWGRSGFYQSGGAFGFRDQLQDAMALVHAEPGLLRDQIVRCAGRQFPEGDVQHWWHPPLGRGVRTRISDDYLFLPAAVCRYVEATGDSGVLDEVVGFLTGRPVDPHEDSYYDLPGRADFSGTVFDHCVRAITHGLRFGEHGLPLMGSGDWNDGMNLVGDEGRGESVWLGMFLYDVLVRFDRIGRPRDPAFADRCAAAAASVAASVELHGWDGAWYRRAWFDDGTPLGSSTSDDCKIDALPQSWAVLSGIAPPDRARQALASLDRELVDRELGLIRLFTPPFDTGAQNPGYIKGYVPGVRENGGQYTHAAVWAVMAFAAAGQTEQAWDLVRRIDPTRHGDDAAKIAVYQVEPYVMSADVYTNPQHAGRGGWTWYTGSAAWMYRLIVESLLGLRLEVDRLHLAPRIPASWPSFEVQYRHRGKLHRITVHNHRGTEVTRVTVDGVDQPDRTIPLRLDGDEHLVEVELGPSPAPA
ncbi:MAG: glucoamylase family protein [Myxococcota bacterium]